MISTKKLLYKILEQLNDTKFVYFQDTVAIGESADAPTRKTYSASRVAEIFGTNTTSKIHIVSLDANNTYENARCRLSEQFSREGNRWEEYPKYYLHPDGRMTIALADPHSSGISLTTFYLVALVRK